MTDQRGQASIELLAGLPALVAAGLIGLQLLVTGYTVTLADGAAEAGALAVVADRPAEEAVRDALPGWARDDVEVTVKDGRISVEVRPPAALPSLSQALSVSSSATVREPAG